MGSILLLGFIVGLRHALEADHVAAVASLAARSPGMREAARQGVIWGLGHTLTLLLIGAVVLALDTVVPARLAHGLELAVGAMLVVLGVDVLRRMVRDRVHFHTHRHADGRVHFHAHSHRGESGHDPSRHEHAHPASFPLRALLVGVVHGMAGSAALILLALQAVDSLLLGLAYILVFGLGSILGMGALAMVIALPLVTSARRLSHTYDYLQGVTAVVTLGLGVWVVYGASGRALGL